MRVGLSGGLYEVFHYSFTRKQWGHFIITSCEQSSEPRKLVCITSKCELNVAESQLCVPGVHGSVGACTMYHCHLVDQSC